ncbi:endonuclease III [Candidatus Jorgensenbacteria bacterium RIFCSPLOWO2_01_FULL_45_25b]|uniref:Endonuclease III n=1 Tax=Candidatus Jorgensenbacteria bacterium RIFCSPLOWO2_01_FULL_45_25b TaxID=1798471 RepID=A0A1F6BTL4_9BACT|nr:MAG: endonuclease III [Candidatus Jorgensenbacteria bacterium RIFCSPLOWO2_01_FULL_45_25b]
MYERTSLLGTRRERARRLIRVLKKLFPKAGMMLQYNTNWELLVAVELSAQCTDKRVNLVTKELFKKYKTLEDYVRADKKEFEKDITSTGFYRNKAKNILKAANIVKEKYGGSIPDSMEEILTLPGVGRKTANVVLGNAYGIVRGIAVDTHVRRFALKFNLTDYKDPKQIEKDLMAIIPQKDWFKFTYLAIEYGRQVCPARKHACEDHPLTKLYPKAGKTWPKSK